MFSILQFYSLNSFINKHLLSTGLWTDSGPGARLLVCLSHGGKNSDMGRSVKPVNTAKEKRSILWELTARDLPQLPGRKFPQEIPFS